MAENEDRFSRAWLPTPPLEVSRFVAAGCTGALSDAARGAYDAPFPDEGRKAEPKVMPTLVPTAPSDRR